MTRDDAIADLAAATSSEILGVEMNIDGQVLQAVRKNLTLEEAAVFAGGRFSEDGLGVEALRITVRQALLSYEPRFGMDMVVDGIKYTIRAVAKVGLNRRLTLIRYLT